MRALVSLLACLGCAACAQSDVIARELARGRDAGPVSGSCQAAVCADFEALAARCTDLGSHVVAGDSCGDADDARPSSRFAICTCTELVTTHAVDVDADLGSGAACNCEPSRALDVAALVDAHADDNDDRARGFDPASLDGFDRAETDPAIELGCGRYYVPDLHGRGTLRLHVTGHALLFVANDLTLDDGLVVTLAPDAALDAFVAGNVRIAGPTLLGSAADAPHVRSYVGGSGTIDLAGDATLAGALYAPRAELVTRGKLEAFGSLLVRRAAPEDDVRVHFDAAARTPVSCALAP